MIAIQKRHFGLQPVLGTSLDWNNPHTRGLEGCYLFNTGGGSIPDLAGKCGPCDPVGTPDYNAPQSSQKIYGTAATCNANQDGSYFANSTYNLPTSDCTIVQFLWPTNLNLSVPDLHRGGSTFGDRNAAGSPGSCAVNCPFDTAIYFDFGGASGSNRINYTFSAGFLFNWHVMAYTAGSLGSVIYEDGVAKVNNGGVAITRTNPTSGFAIGNGYAAGNLHQAIADYALTLIYSRILPAAEIAALSQDLLMGRYSMFLTPGRIRYFIGSARSAQNEPIVFVIT